MGDLGMRQGGLLAWKLCGKELVSRRLIDGGVVELRGVGGHQV